LGWLYYHDQTYLLGGVYFLLQARTATPHSRVFGFRLPVDGACFLFVVVVVVVFIHIAMMTGEVLQIGWPSRM
jgi:hypothetical protein